MAKPRDRIQLTYCVLVGLILIRFLPLFVGTRWLWGVGQLTLLPIGFWIGYGVLGAAALGLPFLPRAEYWAEKLANCFYRTFYESQWRYLHRSVVLLLFGFTFVMFRMPTHFLGDGYTFLSNVGSHVGRWIKWSEGGALIVTMWVQKVVGSGDIPSALLAFQIVSVLSGIITIWCYFLIAEQLSADPIKRLLTFAGLLASGSLLLFFGYVESYPILWGPVTGFLYFSLKYANEGKGLAGSLACLLIAIALHLQAAMYFPAVLFLLLCRGKGREIYGKFKLIIWAGLGLGVIAAGILFYHEYVSNLFFENIFLFPFSGKPIAPGYAIFSLSHVSDLLNLFVLVLPIGLILVTLAAREKKKAGTDVRVTFLGILGIGSLLFLLIVDPSLSMPRDWDLFALCLLAPGVWLLRVIPETASPALKRMLLSVLILGVISAAPFFLVNLNTQRSVAGIEQIAENNPEKSLGTMSILSTYFGMIGDNKGQDSIGSKMAVTYPEFYQWKNAFRLLSTGRREEAFRIFSSARPDRYSKDFHSFLALYYLQIGRPDSALVHAQLAVQLQRYVDVNYAPLAYAYELTGEREKALQALRQGYALNNRNRELIMSLALTHINAGRFDSTLYYAERYRDAGNSDPVWHYLAAKGYYGMKNLPAAVEQAREYVRLGVESIGYADNCRELAELLPEIRSAK